MQSEPSPTAASPAAPLLSMVLNSTSHKMLNKAAKWKLYLAYCEKYAKDPCPPERFGNFETSLDRIADGNERLRNSSVRLGITAFCDRSLDEMQAMALNHPRPPDSASGRRALGQVPADLSSVGVRSIDWRERGAVTPVVDQGDCGCCWAFTAVATLESREAIVHGNLLELSEEQIKDCTYSYSGCNGGWPDHAFIYTHNNPGVLTAQDMPYRPCDNHREGAAVSGVAAAGPGGVAALTVKGGLVHCGRTATTRAAADAEEVPA